MFIPQNLVQEKFTWNVYDHRIHSLFKVRIMVFFGFILVPKKKKKGFSGLY